MRSLMVELASLHEIFESHACRKSWTNNPLLKPLWVLAKVVCENDDGTGNDTQAL